MISENSFDVIVIGNGLIGSAAAKYLSVSGNKTAVIGPGENPDPNRQIVYASHYDQARIQRLIGKDDVWTKLNKAAVSAYPALQEDSGISFHSPVGCLHVNPYGRDGYLKNADSAACSNNLQYTYYQSSKELAADLKDYRFPDGAQGLLEKAPAGSINPRLLIKAQAAVFKKHSGATFTDTVEEVVANGNDFSIKTYEGNIYRANKVLVTAGSFLNFMKLPSPKLQLSIKGEVILLARVSDYDAERLARLPSLLYGINNDSIEGIYLIRPVQYPDGGWYIKMGCNLPGDVYFTTLQQAQAWFRTGNSDRFLPVLTEALNALMPGIAPVEYLTRRCIISRSAHCRPYIGKTTQPALFIAWGCNGYSAMCSDAIGKTAAQCVANGSFPAGFSGKDFELVYEQ